MDATFRRRSSFLLAAGLKRAWRQSEKSAKLLTRIIPAWLKSSGEPVGRYLKTVRFGHIPSKRPRVSRAYPCHVGMASRERRTPGRDDCDLWALRRVGAGNARAASRYPRGASHSLDAGWGEARRAG